ncbi:MarR family winged helix-turn-helix transcriptional regulator [Cryptosporangium arvum]|uniref:MarR family winged helix-turn-helix transcriptional regulator n=1 Tax=Cryptosporangium arvum TaxID=80871 RepID=UPI0004B30AD8|nr:MarR family winged helix-turn-helix transcriptional regulator [Cryptosporangium arvum]
MEARPDLAAMMGPIGRTLVAMELPILREHELSMWGYAVLSSLDDQPVHTQAALAEAINADKTRLIAVLDDLQSAGLIERRPAPGDRRARVLTITPEGRRLRNAVQAAIRVEEERLLEVLPPDQRAVFVDALRRLSAASKP